MTQQRFTLDYLANRSAETIFATPNLTMNQRRIIARRVVDDSPDVGAVMDADGTVSQADALTLRCGKLQGDVTAALCAADSAARFIHPREESPVDAVADDVIGAHELADLAGVGIDTVRSWSHMVFGLKPLRVGNHMLFRRAEALDWLTAHGHLSSAAAVPGAGS